MPPLTNFSDNAFLTRDDFIYAALALVQPLDQYKSPNNARIKIATSTGAGFSETSAQLEGFARPLWAVADLLHLEKDSVQLKTWVDGIKAGTDPHSPEYWGDLGNFSQRMVEMESIAYAILSNPTAFDFKGDEMTKKTLVRWLSQINEYNMPKSNWLWFRVLVNIALVRVLDLPLQGVKHHIDNSLQDLDTFYLGEGWSSDGLWCDERKQADYYSGSFAIQFAQLLFIRFAPDYDAQRTARYKEQAKEFAKSYWRYFGPSGAAIPFGRSLTYRFAFAAFWSAVVVADIELPVPLDQLGTIKGLLARHLRWWAQQPHIFNTDGTPSIGYAYPDMYLAEDYNSPQSVYWCLKPFIILSIPGNHQFWACKELPYPRTDKISDVELVWPPRHILCNTPEHHFLLSSGQSTTKRFKAREAKYGKFAYSSAFGFSVPCGPFLEQLAPDSTLAVSLNDGEEGWKVRWDPYNVQSYSLQVGGEQVPTLISSWRPWKGKDLTIRSTLISSVKRWPGWHIRVHHVKWRAKTKRHQLRLVDSGFAASAQTSTDSSIFEKTVKVSSDVSEVPEGWYKDASSALIISESGASGVVNLTSDFTQTETTEATRRVNTEAIVIRADPNTQVLPSFVQRVSTDQRLRNLIKQRTLIPALQHTIILEDGTEDCYVECTFVTGCFAIESFAEISGDKVGRFWQVRPQGSLMVSTSSSTQRGSDDVLKYASK